MDNRIKYNNKIVYHGSYTVVNKPDISKCKDNKDFGKGFYVTTDKQQAIKFAKLVSKRHSGQKYGVLNTYILTNVNNLLTYEFINSDINWLNCIAGNRRYGFRSLSNKWDKYDIIEGKIADDDTRFVLNNYLSGAYGSVGSRKAANAAITYLKPEKLKNQICFRTYRALSKLQFVRYEKVELE